MEWKHLSYMEFSPEKELKYSWQGRGFLLITDRDFYEKIKKQVDRFRMM